MTEKTETERGTILRQITTHKTNGLNELLEIGVRDEPGPGNACHDYVIYRPYDTVNHDLNANPCQYISFQNGPILEAGVNGVSNEALLAIVQDRLEGFQSGAFACDTNQLALSHVRLAIESLHSRTKDRIARGVEGTNQQ